MRQVGKISAGGGNNKAERLVQVCASYLLKSRELSEKVSVFLASLNELSLVEAAIVLELEYYLKMLGKHIDLVDRRVLKGETIPHKQKVFSVFQPYADFIKKGKLHPNVEIGKKLFVTTDQYHLIVDYQIGDHLPDNQKTMEIANRLVSKYSNIQSLSVDKGFSDQPDKVLLEAFIPEVIIPKKEKRNQKEKQLELSAGFKKLKNKHSAIESNINELEHRGLDRCPDRTWSNFQRYIGLGVCAYNLHKIGRKLQAIELEKRKSDPMPMKTAA